MVDTGNGVFPVFRTPSTNPLNPQCHLPRRRAGQFAWAVFGNVDLRASRDQLEVDVALRYDHDKRENTTQTPTQFLPNVPGFPQAPPARSARRRSTSCSRRSR